MVCKRVLLMSALFLSVCPILALGQTAEPTTKPTPQTGESITIAGAERMVPLLTKLSARFMELHPDVRIEVEGGGSAFGISMQASGAAAASALSRPINDKEIQRLRRTFEAEPVGVPIALDAVIFAVHTDNPLTSLTFRQIEAICSHKMREWSDLGVLVASDLGVPLERIRRLERPDSSGSFAIVSSRVMGGKSLTRAAAVYQTQGELIDAAKATPNALVLTRMGGTQGVKVLPIRVDEDSPAVAPTGETLRNRTYPLTHYLYLYTAGQPTGVLRDLVRFTLSPEGQNIVRDAGTGAVPLSFSRSSRTPSSPEPN